MNVSSEQPAYFKILRAPRRASEEARGRDPKDEGRFDQGAAGREEPLGHADWLEDPEWSTPESRLPKLDKVFEEIEKWTIITLFIFLN